MNKTSKEEQKRLRKMRSYENRLRKEGFVNIAGIDEAGRGPWAGPVVAAACIIPKRFFVKDLKDSKKLLPGKRKRIYEEIIRHKNVLYGIGIVESSVIDRINILEASFRAMMIAVENLPLKPDFLLFDGKFIPATIIPSKGLIKGDDLSISISAASIIAKETRDDLMRKYHEKWPEWRFNEHKGYGTKLHQEMIKKYGVCEIHRKSFEPVRLSLSVQNQVKNIGCENPQKAQ